MASIFLLTISACLFLFCNLQIDSADSPLQSTPIDCVTDWTSGSTKDYFPEKLDELPAIGFRVKYFGNYKTVENLLANETYVLYMCGTSPPSQANSSLPPNVKVFKIPLNSLAVIDTTILTFLDVLGVSSRIQEVDLTYVNSPCLLFRGQVSNLTNFNFYGSAALTLEAVKKVDAVLAGPSANSQSKYIAFSAAEDPGNLKRTAWLGFLSTFFNLEARANQLFNTISDNYDCYQSKVANAQHSPIVLWVSYDAPASWNGNKRYWSVSNANYKQELIADAGGMYKQVDEKYDSFDLFQQMLLAQNVEILIDETYAPTLNDTTYDVFLKNFPFPANASFTFLKNQNVFRTDKTVNQNMGLAWYESSVVLADEVLQDFISVVHPEAVPASFQRKWFRNVSKNEPILISTGASCQNLQTPYQLKNETSCLTSSTSSAPSTTLPTNIPTRSSAMSFHSFCGLFVWAIICLLF